jgi:hypothetical protein
MKRLVVALVASSALAFGALAQSSSGISSQNQVSTGASQSGASRSDSVNVRANVRTGGNRTTVRTRSDSPSVVHRSSRTRHVTSYEDRPSKVTVIKKKKKYAKRNRGTYAYASRPSSSTVVERRRSRGVIAETGVSRSRVMSERRTGTSVGVSTRTRTTTGSSSTTNGSGGVNVQGTVNTR